MGLLGLIMLIAGIITGLYTGVIVMFVGGIVDIIEVIKADFNDSGKLAFGIVKMIFASPVGFIVYLVFYFISNIIWMVDGKEKNRNRLYKGKR